MVADSADRGQQPVRHPRGGSRLRGQARLSGGTFDPDDPFEIEAASAETTSDNSFSWAPGTSTADADRLVLCVSSILRDSNTASVPVCTNAALSALASRANYCTSSGAGGGFGVTEGAKAAAGSVGTFACTYGASSPKAYLSFAIKPKPAAATVLDTANRADGAVGANWTTPFDAGLNTLVISSNHFTGSGGTYPDGIWVASTPGADQEVYITVGASVSDEYWFYLRAADSSNFYVIDSTGDWGKKVAGSRTSFGSFSAPSLSAGDVIGVRVVGDTFTFLKNGSVVATATDSDLTAGGKIGFGFHSVGYADDFGGGTVATVAAGAGSAAISLTGSAAGSAVSPAAVTVLLLESSDGLLLESGGNILLEDSSLVPSGAATITLAPSATGTRTRYGAGTASVSVSAAAAGTRTTFATATASLAVTAAAIGQRTAIGSGSAALAFTANAAGQRTVYASGATQVSLAAIATGVRTVFGSGSAALALAAEAAGQPLRHGAGTAQVAFAASASATRGAYGSAAATLALTAEATGVRSLTAPPPGRERHTRPLRRQSRSAPPLAASSDHPRRRTAALTLTAEASGQRTTAGGATAALTFSAAATGVRTTYAAGTATLSLAASAVPTRHRYGSGTATFALAAQAFGGGVRTASGTAAITVTAAAAATRTTHGAATTALTLTTSATGRRILYGAGSATLAITAEAAAAANRYGAGSATVTLSAQAAGMNIKTGSGQTTLALAAIAVGRRGAYTSATAPLTISTQATGTRHTYAAASASIAFGAAAAGQRITYGVGDATITLFTQAEIGITYPAEPPGRIDQATLGQLIRSAQGRIADTTTSGIAQSSRGRVATPTSGSVA